MRYFAFILLASIFHLHMFAQNPTLKEMRTMYGHSIQDQDEAEAYYEKMTSLSSKDPLILAYRGAAAALMGKHVFNPMRKLDYLAEAEGHFVEAVQLDAANPEIRFLRFSYQHYLPTFLGYSGDIDSDMGTMLTALRARAEELRRDELLFVTMIRFLLDSKRCEDEDDEYLRTLLAQS